MNNERTLEHIMLHLKSIVFARLESPHSHYYHWHQCLEIIYISSGYGLVVVDNNQYTAKPGRLFIFPPFRLHKVQVDATDKYPYHRTVMHIEQHQLLKYLDAFPRHKTSFLSLSSSNSPAQIHDMSDKSVIIENILENFSMQQISGEYSPPEVAFMLMQLIDHLPSRQVKIDTIAPTKATLIMDWVETHFMEKCTLKNLAQELNLSPNYISRIFRAQTGGQLQEYIVCRRIKHSCEILRNSSVSIAEIAQASGFNDVSYFISCFKKLMKQTPLQYRKKDRQ